MTCKETIETLGEYLGAELTPEVLRRLEGHLDICAPCRAYLATYRRTKDLAVKVNRVDLPEALKARLRALLSDQAHPRS